MDSIWYLRTLILLVYQAHKDERLTKKQSTIYSDQSLIREYTRRIKSLSIGKLLKILFLTLAIY